MAKVIHHYNGDRTDCSKKITSKVHTSKNWNEVTCTDCKQIANNSWRGMSG